MMGGHGRPQQGQDYPEGEMVEIDVLQGHHHPHQNQYQPPYQNNNQQMQQNQQYQQPQYQEQYQEYSQNPYGSPYQNEPTQSQEQFGRALTNNAPSPYQQQEGFQPPYNQQQQYQQPHAVSGDELYGPPGWANRHSIGMAGAPSIGPSISGMDTPVESRSATPTLKSGANTPFDHLAAPRHPWSTDSTPNSPMNQSHQSLQNLLPGQASPVLAKEWVEGSDQIARLHKRDDSDIWGGWKRHVFRMVPILTILATGMYLVYLALRIYCVISAQQLAKEIYAQAWVFIAVEITVAIPSIMHNIWTMWSMKKRQRPKLRLMGEDVPTVDVLLTCCGEEDDLVLDTARAACDVDYPRDRFRVIICDDGKSEGLESGIAALAMTYPNVHYLCRPKYPGVPHHFKAGNLNYALDFVHTMPGGAGQFMAALDADMIPERDWLRAILPHMLIDPKVALACPPQLFYNTPPSDPLAQSLDFFVHVIEPIKDALGVAWCTGSGYCVRREALDEIGNFPLGSLAEDVATSTLMLGKGWKTAYIHEPLQFGTVPEDYGGHLKQRTRWAIGTVDTSFKLNFCLYGEKVKQMTVAQRFSGFLYATLSLYTILLTLSMFAIPIILVMGKPLVAYANYEQLRWLIRACFAATLTNRLCEFALFIPAGYHTGQRGSRYQLWMSPYIALCIIRSFILPTWLGGQTQAFKPTGSLGSALNERDPKTRKGMFRRLWGILFNYMAIFHLAFVYLTLVGVVLTSYRCFYVNDELRDILMCLITHAFWPPLTFIFICSSLWTPIAYAIDPPNMPDREQLLERDPKTFVAHPTPQSKKIAFGGQAAWFETELTVTSAYTILVFVLSFIY
ncbi:glycosyltransferase family 2 [Colletotrichum abscissum]|nr:glycosyltransferase family 2 [Colletotrichum costaricense]XP_060402648.1 glycosyltransferase family 2 [Colletotrichum abscissum]KAI3557812.1 glycosyltransferase family 2 [Colletotrichum abscissum]KAK1510114.1 glycosyltransferase family 2 [Colletotrichum abscissum]KAK1512531.1 glycosyltransferase family 2 [Colletotrichum costaricense]